MMPRQSQWRWIVLFLVSLVLCVTIATVSEGRSRAVAQVAASSQPSSQLVQQGIQSYKIGKFEEAIGLWQQALTQTTDGAAMAIIRTNLAQAYQQMGQPAAAIAQWEQVIQLYRTADTEQSRSQLAQALTEQAQVYSDLGQYQQAIELLQSALDLAQKAQNQRTIAAAQGSLGNAYYALGNYEQALIAHQASLKVAQELSDQSYTLTTLNNLGNLYTSRAERYRDQSTAAQGEGERRDAAKLSQLATQEFAAAQATYEKSLDLSRRVGGMAEVKALINLSRLEQTTNQTTKLDLSRVTELLSVEPDSREKAYALISLAIDRLPVPSSRTQATSPPPALLEQALATARNIRDSRAESYALGSLGQLYEAAKQYPEAMQWTRQAQFAAQQVSAPDSLYRWQWQAARILRDTGETQQAIDSYKAAIATLQSIRGDIVAANRELQFNFRDSVEPVYRELISLLLPPSGGQSSNGQASGGQAGLKAQTSSENIGKVLELLELLKLAELQNFFGDECVQVAQASAQGQEAIVDPTAAVIYSIILDDRTEMILRTSNNSLTRYSVPLSKQAMRQEIDQLRTLLEKRATDEYLLQAQKIYDALIRPLEPELAASKPQTLVFIQDSVLRKVPMVALHDGQQFLVQKYAVATTPSLSLTTRKPLDRQNLQALILGLTVERAPFAALANVGAETESVQKILGGTKLIDKDFTVPRLENQLQKTDYPIVHMATHGKFGVDSASTFLLGYDARITINQLDNLFRLRKSAQPIELLTLSACQTAAGDDRSALGIAGVAVRAGVKSALASLWYIDDAGTVPLIEEFYKQLQQPDVTKAEALRQAQMKLISDLNFGHPAVWSPFILIGNWL